MSTLPILDYGAPAEGAGAGGEGAPGQPAAVPENAVPTDGAAFAREAAIVPPEGADDLVSRAQWQWAIGESEAARGAEGASSSPAGDERATSPGTTKKRPIPRSRASPNAISGDGKKGDGKKKTETTTLPRPGASVATSKNTESRRAAETAIARVEMTEARAKLAVVERLLEDKPVRCADSEYRRAAGEKNDAAALEELRRLVAPLTGEEFMRACEERCLAGKCGWPLCGAPTRFSGVSGSGCPGDDDARAVRRTTPDGSAGSVRRGRGTYRIDAVRRKVYLRGDLDMFCGDAHRAEAEAVGVSLALPLDSEVSDSSAAKETRKEAEDGAGAADDANRAAATRTAMAKAKAMGDANVNVKAAVFEKRPPAVVERRAPDASAPAPRAPSLAGLLGGGKGNEAAAAVEGYVPRRERASAARTSSRRRVGEVSQKKSGRHETTVAVTKPEAFVEPPEPENGSSLGARALDLRLEKAARADDSTLASRGDPSDPSTMPPAATFLFDVFAEGLERAERGSNIMGAFSEGQLSRVVPEAALPGLGLEAAGGGGDDNGASGETGGDAADDDAVAAAIAAATSAAEAATSAAQGPLDVRRGAAAEQALVQAREALKATLMKVGASGDDRAGDGDGYDSRAESSSDSDDDYAVTPGAVSEFGTTWMMLDGWVTRATFAYVSADDTLLLSSSSSSPDVSIRRTQNGSDPEPIAALPPRLGYAKQMSDAAASELRRALPSVRAALGIRASVLNLERSLGELMRTFFFDASIPSLRPERWAVLVAAMLERGVAARAAAVARKKTHENKRAATRSSEASGTETEEDASSRLVPHIAEDVAAARRDDGPLWALVAAAGASKEEYEAYGDLIAGECAKSW